MRDFEASLTHQTLSFVFRDRPFHPPPYRRELRTVEEDVQGTGDQPGHGLHDGLLWIKHYYRGQLLWSRYS